MNSGSTRRGVLVVNLGTPATPERRDVARYLRQFLSDPRVVDLPRWLWLPLLYLVIVPLRAPRSAAAYRKIWTEEGSPLLTLSAALAERLGETLGPEVDVRMAMRYGAPSVPDVMRGMKEAGVDDLVVLPLYPQFSYTTTASVFDAVEAGLAELRWTPTLRKIEDYYEDEAWLDAVADSIRAWRAEHGSADRLMFSLHGIPQRYDRNGDPYAGHCCSSAVEIARRLELEQPAWYLTFQSRVGREPWLQPYTDMTLKEWAEQGVRTVQVACPGFAVDCIETLEEIAMENAEEFHEAGGERLEYIPCLNDSERHAEVLAGLVRKAWAQPSEAAGGAAAGAGATPADG